MFESMRPIWWLPTFGFFMVLGLELWMMVGAPRMFEDPGVGRHLRTAEVILETGQIPRTDPLSFTYAGQPWTDFEWAFETTLGEVYRAGGLGLVCAFAFAVFAFTLLGVYRTLLQSGVSTLPVVIVTGLVFLTLHLHFSVRPVLFTYLFMALVVEVWRRQPIPRTRDWLILPVVFVAWANLHAGWAAALIFLVGSLAGRLMDRLAGRVNGEEAPLIPWTGLTLLCTVAISFNPWGWHLFRQVFLFATTYQSFKLWDEYLPPNFAGPSMSAITVLFIVLVVFLARLFRRAPVWRWETIVPILFFLDEGLKSQRHVLLLMIVAAVPVAVDLQAILQGPWFPFLRTRMPFFWTIGELLGDILDRFQERQRIAGGDAWLSFIAAVGMTVLYLHTPLPRLIFVGAAVTPKMVSFVRAHPDRFHRPLTTTWNAGPLLWHLRPDFRVSFDDRGDFYGDKTVFSFVDLYAGAEGWREIFAKGNYDSAILDRHLQLNQVLTTLPGWREVYRDNKTSIYWKD